MINDLDDDLDGLFAGAAAPYPGRDLENDALLNASVDRGIGHICASKYGW